jgi:hypothetical protein
MSFTGSSIPIEVKSVSIDYFRNQAPIVQPTLSQVFTDALKDRFISQTNLEMVDDFGDFSFEGVITNYNTKPTAITGEETAAMNRLTISVKVKFQNNQTESPKSFERSFSAYADYDSSESLESVEETLIEEIVEQLVDNIFNATASNW